jgi:hypothetical protein
VLPWEEFYTTTCAAALRDLDLSGLLTELLAAEAIVVAKALPATSSQALVLEQTPARVFGYLRRGELSATDVERRFRTAIDEVCPDGSPDLRAVLSSLHKRELSEVALTWLGGGEVSADGLQHLGASQRMRLSEDAVPAISALAAICLRLNRVFLLGLDELERMTDWRPGGATADPRVPDRTNIEWLRRLAEGIARYGGVLIVAGQPRAWQQPPDVVDRLASRRLIDLTVWDTEKVRQLVAAGNESWAGRWEKGTYEAVVELCGGNIRRIQTVLFELFARTADEEDRQVTLADVQTAARRLHQSDGRPDLIDPIARAAESRGGSVERGVAPIEGLVFDLFIRKGGQPHLAVRQVTVGDNAELARSGVETWQHLNRLRQDERYMLHGLLIVLGANDPRLVATLGNYSTLTVIDGEAPDAEEKARSATIARMEEAPEKASQIQPTIAADRSVAEEAFEIAGSTEDAKLSQRMRLAELYPDLAGPESAFSVADLDVDSALLSRGEIERLRIVQRFADDASAPLPIERFLIRSDRSVALLIGVASLAIFWIALIVSSSDAKWGMSPDTDMLLRAARIANVVIPVMVLGAGLAALFIALRERDRARLSRRMAFNVVHEMMLRDCDAAELARARSRLDFLVSANDTNPVPFDRVLKDDFYGARDISASGVEP